MEAGYTALYQKCVHLGCRVPECKTSQWFECQCHGSQYNRNGEKKGGPAPRGLDRFPLTVDERQRERRHRARSSPARRSAPTPPARRPKARTASAAGRVTELVACSERRFAPVSASASADRRSRIGSGSAAARWSPR